MSIGHNHTDADETTLNRNLWITAVLNSVITIFEFFGGILSGSLALLSDAVHNLSDVVAVVLALWARWVSRRPPTTRHTYGFKRVEVMVALVNAVALIAVTALIVREAIMRLWHPEPVARGVMLIVAIVAVVANGVSVLLLRHHEKNDVNIRSAFLHMAQDALASIAVVVAALLAKTSIGLYVDPAAAIIVSILVLHNAYSIGKETISALLEGAPLDINIAEIAEKTNESFVPAQLHHLHLWEIGPGQRLLTAHVTLGCNMDGRAIEALFLRIKEFLNKEYEINHATLEPEISGCDNPELLGRWQKSGSE